MISQRNCGSKPSVPTEKRIMCPANAKKVLLLQFCKSPHKPSPAIVETFLQYMGFFFFFFLIDTSRFGVFSIRNFNLQNFRVIGYAPNDASEA